MNNSYQSRRNFLKGLGAVAGVAAVSTGLVSCAIDWPEKNKEYDFIGSIDNKFVSLNIDRSLGLPPFEYPPLVLRASESKRDVYGITEETIVYYANGSNLKLYSVVQETKDKKKVYRKDDPVGKEVVEKAQTVFDDYLRRILEQKKREGKR